MNIDRIRERAENGQSVPEQILVIVARQEGLAEAAIDAVLADTNSSAALVVAVDALPE